MLFKKLKSSLFLVSSLLATKALGAFWEMGGDIYCHDPSVIKEGDRWYAFCTGEGIQVLTSSDSGATWVRAPQIFLSELSWWSNSVPQHSGLDVWAPDVEYFNGRVWLYYSISTFGSKVSAIGLTSATSIGAGAWRDDGLVMVSADDYNAIDPNLVVDQSGNPWLAFGSFWGGLKITAVNPSTMRPTGPIYSIAARSSSPAIEAASIIYHDGYYYLFNSIDTCCQGTSSTYKIAYSRSTSITGPYYDRNGNPAMQTGGTVLDAGNEQWIGPGGEDVYGNVIARHAYDALENGAAKLLINDLNWSNGWPTY
ncbi:protein AbnA [Zychaea mexicana]|uniref:protein AbnA n=1 Tax=Zychaea mexicana TaxID=64656 RepID=UPI0022FEC9F0|nr:protein AbnA [Zychaea mexicana]KAI9498397.1 protein AbnA [Zychaea mexicana]